MRILNLVKHNNKKTFKKSQMLLFGSLLVFVGLLILTWNSLVAIRDEVYSDLKIEIVTQDGKHKTVAEVPVANNLEYESNTTSQNNTAAPTNNINYDNYLGVLEIPKIGLKRGFYGTDNKYNNIQYNVTMVRGSTLPDVVNGNLILMAHSGDAYISYFAYLYRLNIGDKAYVTYNKKKYTYKIVNIYDVPKVGKVAINRNYDRTTMTLITCTKDNDYSQTIYILEQV